MNKALICGISGQDGAYLADFLLKKEYEVHGSSRDVHMSSFTNLAELGIKDRIKFHSLVPTDFRSVLQVLLKVSPDEVYNLAGPSPVALSFEQPVETMESICIGTLNLLEAIRFAGKPVKLYNAASSEAFGDTGTTAADEQTPFRPRSPYAVAKAAAFWEVANYREAYKIHACSGILFNHESPLRPERFVTQKIVAGACRIAAGLQDKLHLGNLAVSRDWGWAPEYIEAMWLMLQQPNPEDYVIATGQTHSLEEFVEQAFLAVNLDWRKHVVSDPKMLRPTDILLGLANPAKAKRVLGWTAKNKMPDVVRRMIEAYRNKHERHALPA